MMVGWFHLWLAARLFTSQIATRMHLVNKNYCKSGQNGNDFNEYSKGDLTLNYMHFMIKDNDMLLTLVNKELEGDAAVESGLFAGPVGAVGGGCAGHGEQPKPPSTATRSNTAANTTAKRTSRANASTFASIARSSATMAEASARRTAALMVKELTGALTANRAAGSPLAVINALEAQLVEAIKDCSSKRKRPEGGEAVSERGGDSDTTEKG